MPISNRQEYRLQMQLWILKERGYLPEHSFTVADLGTEHGLTGKAIREAYPKAKIFGVEIHQESYEVAKTLGAYDQIWNYDAVAWLRHRDEFDVVVAAELIEHLTKEEGHYLLSMLRDRAGLSIVTSPIGFHEQGPLYGNPHQVHVSGWTEAEMRELGWKTFCLMPDMYCSLGVYYR